MKTVMPITSTACVCLHVLTGGSSIAMHIPAIQQFWAMCWIVCCCMHCCSGIWYLALLIWMLQKIIWW